MAARPSPVCCVENSAYERERRLLTAEGSPRNNCDLVPIYTDWANHYLEKAGRSRLIENLQHDMQDSLLLIDVIEAVTNERIPDVNRHPRTAVQLVDNIDHCLRFLEKIGVNVQGLVAKDIRDGQLRAVLGLFFSLSRYKQQQKSLHAAAVTSKLPTPASSVHTLNNNNNNNCAKSSDANMLGRISLKSGHTASSLPHSVPATSQKVGGGQPSSIPSKAVITTDGNASKLPPSGLKKPGQPTRALVTNIPAPSGTVKPTALKAPTATNTVKSTSSQIAKPCAAKTTRDKSAPMLEKFKLFAHKDKSSSPSPAPAADAVPMPETACVVKPPKSSSRASKTPSSSGFSSGLSSDGDHVAGTASTMSTAPTGQCALPSSKLLKGANCGGLPSPKTTTKRAAKCAELPTVPPAKVSGSAQTSPYVHKKQTPSDAIRSSSSNSKHSDVDSAYYGLNDSASSPSSSTASSKSAAEVSLAKPTGTSGGSKLLRFGERKPPQGSSGHRSSNEELLRSPSSNSACGNFAQKPTMAVIGTTKSPSTKNLAATALLTDGAASCDSSPSTKPLTRGVDKRLTSGAGSLPLSENHGDRKHAVRSNSSSQLKTIPAVAPPPTSPTVGVVSPMTHHRQQSAQVAQRHVHSSADSSVDLNSSFDSLTGGQHSDSHTSSSGNQSDAQSVIYCPSADEQPSTPAQVIRRHMPEHARSSASPAKSSSPARTSSRIETTFDAVSGDVVVSRQLGDDELFAADAIAEEGGVEDTVDVKPMEPLVYAAPSSFCMLRGLGTLGHTLSSNLRLTPENVAAGRKPHIALSARPLGSNYAALQLLSATQLGLSDDDTSAAASAGYVSESETALRVPDSNMELEQTGYHSEGGISLYVKRMQATFKEGMAVARDNLRKPLDGMMEDSYEDSSSVSSGLSENVDEISTDDLTGSSLSDHHTANPCVKTKHCGSALPLGHTADMGQQTERAQQSDTRAKLKDATANVSTGNRSRVGDFDPAAIQQLLHQSRTVARLPNGTGEAPMRVPTSQTAGGRLLSMSAQARTPMVSGGLKLLSKQHTASSVSGGTGKYVAPVTGIPRPASAAGNSRDCENGAQIPPPMTGYHSLDRKKHLLSQFGTDLSLFDPCDATLENLGDTGVAMSPVLSRTQLNAGTLAMLSPRNTLQRTGGGAGVAIFKGKETADHASPTCARQNLTGGATTMSRSLVEQELKQLAASSSALAATAAAPMSVSRTQNGTASNATASLCMLPQSNGLSLSQQSPRVPSAGRQGSSSNRSSQSEVGFPTHNGTADLLMHKLTASANGQLTGSFSSQSAYSAPGVMGGLKGAPFAAGGSPYLHNMLSKTTVSGDDRQGSSWSLASSSASYTSEERYQMEIRKLHREVDLYREKVDVLMTQQTTYENVVGAFEQSLDVMRKRLNALLTCSEQKESELVEMKQSLDHVYQFCRSAGLNVEHILSPNLQRRHTFAENGGTVLLTRQPSSESMASMRSTVSQKSSGSGGSSRSKEDKQQPGKKSWLRSSFSRAFTRTKKNKHGSMSDVEEHPQSESSPNSPYHTPRVASGGVLKPATSSSALSNDQPAPEAVEHLRKQLDDKDAVLTDLRLEALSSAHQLDHMKEQLAKYKTKMSELLHDNERLRGGRHQHDSTADALAADVSTPMNVERIVVDGQEGFRVNVAVVLGPLEAAGTRSEMLIGSIAISAKTRWDLLDSIVDKLFKEYVLRIDAVSNLGLSAESLVYYVIGSHSRVRGQRTPDHPPAHFVVPTNGPLRVVLHAMDALAFQTLIPKHTVHKLVAHLMDKEHRRLMLCGPSGSGKTYLAHRLAEFVATRLGRNAQSGCIAAYNVDQRTAKDLKPYLKSLADRCVQSNGNDDVPLVLILDNLHDVHSLTDAFSVLPAVHQHSFPYLIGTINQSQATTSLQLNYGFRVALWSNHTEPMRGFLMRYLRRRLIEHEVRNVCRLSPEVHRIVDWLPKVWLDLNKFIEEVSGSTDASIGPRVFLPCPLDVTQARLWFIQLWNQSIAPYLLDVARDSYHERRTMGDSWEDPTDAVLRTWPWTDRDVADEQLMTHIRIEDVVDAATGNAGLALDDLEDPYQMLLRLREHAGKSKLADTTLTVEAVESNI